MPELARFRVLEDHDANTGLVHDCGWSTDWSWRDKVTLQTIVDAARAHDAECPEVTA